MMSRKEFTPKTKALAFERSGGRCEKCGCKLMPGEFQYDHTHPAAAGGDNGLDNCRVLCNDCHDAKTNGTRALRLGADKYEIAKHKRIAKKANEPRKPGKIQSRGFEKRFKKKLNGKVERR